MVSAIPSTGRSSPANPGRIWVLVATGQVAFPQPPCSRIRGTAYFANDVRRAHRDAARLEAGNVCVNEWFGDTDQAPFGGYNASGIGRQEALEAPDPSLQIENVAINLDRGVGDDLSEASVCLQHTAFPPPTVVPTYLLIGEPEPRA